MYELNTEIKTILDEIYQNVYCGFRNQYIIVFLCGGASRRGYKSRRDKVREFLEKEKRTRINKAYKVFYPEDLLIDILNKTKGADLLSYEKFLANNSDKIVIICESPGSLVELGAFTNNDFTVDKVVAAVDKKYVNEKSFIMLGPIKYLRKRNNSNYIEYGQDDKEFAKKLSKILRSKNDNADNSNGMIDLTSIIGMHYFIQLLLYFLKELYYTEFEEIIGYIFEKQNIENDGFNVLFNAALKLLFMDKKLVKMPGKKYSSYKLTDVGFQTMRTMISDCTKADVCDRIRVKLMYYGFYKSPHS